MTHTRAYAQICMLLKCAQIIIQLRIILNFLLQQPVNDTVFILKKTWILRKGFWSVTRVALLRKAAEQIGLR
jgi:hypothetical protein